MSEWRQIRDGIPDLVPMTDRSPGMHVSTIIHHLCVQRGDYKERDSNSELPMSRLQLGCALETAIADRYALTYPGRYIRPGELCKDGLFGTPDLFDCQDSAVEEVKLTWMSSNLDWHGDKIWKYTVQVMAYCHMMDVSLGRLHIAFVNGDYRAFEVHYPVLEREFTRRELIENWAMLLTHGRKLERESRMRSTKSEESN